MERHLDAEITGLKQSLVQMAGAVEFAIEQSVLALKDRNADLATQVIDGDALINRHEIEIEDKCLTILARQQPVAADLRLLLACVKINSDLERMGDHAVNIAQRALGLMQHPPLKPLIDLPRMTNLVQRMLKDALDAFVELDVAKAQAVCESDDAVDDIEDQIQRELLTYMMQDPKLISKALALSMIARELERIADLSTNVGEEVIFIKEAKNIKHQYQDIHVKP
jgi:phosphate transport system protein